MSVISIEKLFTIIGRQTVEIELLKQEVEQLKTYIASLDTSSGKAMQQDKNDLVKLNQG